MRRWTILPVALALIVAFGSAGYAQTPSGGDKMMDKKDDKMMDKDKMKDKMDDKMMDKDKPMDKKDGKMSDKDKMMDKKDDKMMDKK